MEDDIYADGMKCRALRGTCWLKKQLGHSKMDRHVRIEDTSFYSLGPSPNRCSRMRVLSSVKMPL